MVLNSLSANLDFDTQNVYFGTYFPEICGFKPNRKFKEICENQRKPWYQF